MLGVLPGVIGLIQATEAIKRIVGIGTSLVGRLLVFDALEMRFRELKLRKDPNCPVCGTHPTIRALIDYEAWCGVAPHDAQERNGSVSSSSGDITPAELKAKIDAGERIELVDVREDYELDIAKLPYTHWIPLSDLRERMSELDKTRETIVYCRSGSRSAAAVATLQSAGFTKARNLTGGILRWADDVDPSMEKY